MSNGKCWKDFSFMPFDGGDVKEYVSDTEWLEMKEEEQNEQQD